MEFRRVLFRSPEEKPPISHDVTFIVPYNPKEDDIEKDADSEDNSDDENEETSDEQEETKDQGSQNVEIYVDDMDHDVSEVYEQEPITGDKELTLTLTIEPDNNAEYKVMRDDEMIVNKAVTYDEEGE